MARRCMPVSRNRVSRALGFYNFTARLLAVRPPGAAAWGVCVSDLEPRERLRGGARQGRFPAAGHGSRSPPARSPAAGRTASGSQSRRDSPPGPTASRGRAQPRSPGRLAYTPHFFLRSFRRTLANDAPQPPRSRQTFHIHVPRPARLEAGSTMSPATLTVTAGGEKCPDANGPRL